MFIKLNLGKAGQRYAGIDTTKGGVRYHRDYCCMDLLNVSKITKTSTGEIIEGTVVPKGVEVKIDLEHEVTARLRYVLLQLNPLLNVNGGSLQVLTPEDEEALPIVFKPKASLDLATLPWIARVFVI